MQIDPTWRELIANIAVIALFTAIWSLSMPWLEAVPRAMRPAVTGVIIGCGAALSMTLSINLGPGVFFDMRAAIVAVGALFGGPVAAVVSVAIACAYRVVLGGAGIYVGVVGLVAGGGMGLALRCLGGQRNPRPIAVAGLGVVVAAIYVTVPAVLPNAEVARLWAAFALPAAVTGFVGTLLMGLTLLQAGAGAREKLILRAALVQAPDFHYLKDRDSAFIAVNLAVARHNGFTNPAEMVGKTDFDLCPEDRARALFQAEQEMLRTGTGIFDFEERVIDADGQERWYRSSKTPLCDNESRIIGLAGVTVDCTAQKRLESALNESRDVLDQVLSEMRDAIVLYDRDARMVFCNAEYLRMFDMTADVRRPGVHLRDVVGAMARSGEVVNLPADVDGWVEGMVASLFVEGEMLLEMHDGRFLLRRNRPVAGGSALIVFSDVTELKRAEGALRAANAELSLQATTDGLTGLANRRAFDARLANEIDRKARDRGHLSLLLLDVDQFKAFNDIYGHQAGDDCLRAIAQSLGAAVRRPADLVARYGGEEFAVILPDTDEAGAACVAAEIARILGQRALAHEGAESGRVSVSIGLGHFGAETMQGTPETLVGRADEALYAAKAAGRDRVCVWRERLSA